MKELTVYIPTHIYQTDGLYKHKSSDVMKNKTTRKF